MIVGFCGCGKSTLARQLGTLLNIEPTYMDALHWLPGWVESSNEHKINLLTPILKRDRWIVEGSYRAILYKERMEKADTIIFLDFNRFLCLYRVIKRRIMYNGKTRPDMGEGCKEKLDLEFLKWVVYDCRKKRRKIYEELFFAKKKFGTDKKIYIFRKRKDVNRFIERIERNEI